MLRPVPSVSFHLCLSCIFVCVLIYRFTAPALAFIAARPQLSAGFPIDSRWSPKIHARMPTASGIPTRSPITVLTRPGEA